MKISEHWLRELTGLNVSQTELIERLTMAGIESHVEEDVLEADLTPNRGDCLSAMGLARELSAIFKLAPPKLPHVVCKISQQQSLPIDIQDPKACPRYCGRVITGLNQQVQIPAWIQTYLQQSQINLISPIVDICNYVMLELGQPLHAFALDKIKQKIIVRQSKANESLALLNGQEVKLQENTLIIADEAGPVALAGIMGGAASAVDENTTAIFLESAFFTPTAIAGRARRYTLSTDASQRFERGVDPQLAVLACERATQLLLEICDGEAGPICEMSEPTALPIPASITLRAGRLSHILGIDIAATEITNLLHALQFTIMTVDGGQWQLQAPSFRFDIQQEIDVIEEIVRLYGYHHVPAQLPVAEQKMATLSETEQATMRLRQHLVTLGYREAITYSFVAPKMNELLNPSCLVLELSNPISSELSVMRTTLWASLLPVLRYNCDRQVERLRLFEIGRRFQAQADSTWHEEEVIAGLAYGAQWPSQWAEKSRLIDFYDLKQDIVSLLALTGLSWEFASTTHPALHPGQTVALLLNGQQQGLIGVLHPQLKQAWNLAFSPILFEISLPVLQQKIRPRFQEISKFPTVVRDLAFILPQEIQAAAIMATMKQYATEKLQSLEFFDVYQGKNIKERHKSIALRLSFHCLTHTLTDEEINDMVNHIVLHMRNAYSAELRDF